MEKENSVLSNLAQGFPALDIAQAVVARRRIYLEAPAEGFMDLLIAAKAMGFTHLCTITGMDTGSGYAFIYHIANKEGILMSLKYRTGGGDGMVIPSVLPIYEGATFYERELEGLLGVKVDGLPEGRQYPLPDNWPEGQYPMRKDWKPATKGQQE